MKIDTFVIGMLGTNCYLAGNERTKECFLVDPALYQPGILNYIRENGMELKAILLTHGHFDHIMGINRITAEMPVPVYAHEAEEILLTRADYNASQNYGRPYTYSDARYVKDGQVLEIAGLKILVIHTPGHTVGGCCYYIEEENTLFSGDTLFYESVGRTDMATGSGRSLVSSIREKLFVLPDETKVYPGHMQETTIGHEKQYNPYI